MKFFETLLICYHIETHCPIILLFFFLVVFVVFFIFFNQDLTHYHCYDFILMFSSCFFSFCFNSSDVMAFLQYFVSCLSLHCCFSTFSQFNLFFHSFLCYFSLSQSLFFSFSACHCCFFYWH